MIQIKSVEPHGESDWESLVASCEGNALHLPAIHQVYQDPKTLAYLAFEDAGQVLACAIAFEVKPRRLRWPRGKDRILLLPTAPAIADASRASDVWESLLDFARESGFERLQVQPSYGRWLPSDDRFHPYRTTSITEFLIDLRRTEEDVLATMHKTHRKNIRRAAKQGLRIEEDHSVDGLLRLRDLQMASSERASERTEGFAVSEEDFFQKLHEYVYAKGYGQVLFAHLDEEPVAALAWLSAANRAVTVRSGSVPAGYQARAMYLLHEELIRRAIAAGIVELNIGAVPSEASEAEHAQAGLYEFKNGFGGEPVVRHGLDIPVKEIVG